MKPNDPLYKDQWHLHIMDMEKVWDIETGSPEVIVAVIEAGFDVHHPDIKNQIYKSVNTFGPNDNMVSEDPNHPENRDGQTDHGTHILGLIAAQTNNNEGGCGVAPTCRLMPIKIANNLSDDDLSLGIRTAVDEGARVINLSNTGYCYIGKMGERILPRQGTPPRTDTLLEACRYAAGHNVLICTIFAGNQGFFALGWPAAYHTGLVVSQGSLDGKNPANFCAACEYTDVMSPGGQRVPSGDADWPWGMHPDEKMGLLSTIQVKNGSYKYWSGGCMSTGVASGVAGLLYSRFPHLTVEQARQVIRNTAKGRGWDSYRGHGYINPLGIVSLDRVECELELASAAMKTVDGKAVVELIVRNNGVLDAKDTLVMLYANEPDTPAMRQLRHAAIPVVRGLESVTVELSDFNVPDGTKNLWVMLDPKFQLSEKQRCNGDYSFKMKIRKGTSK